MGRERGFTIVEVLLFLGISAALSLIAFSYTTSTIRSTRFTDGSNQLSEHIRNQIGTVKNLSIERPIGSSGCSLSIPNTPPGRSGCTVLGRVLYFEERRVTSYVVLGTAVPTNTDNDRDAIATSNPRVIENSGAILSEGDMQLAWDIGFTNLAIEGTGQSFNTMFILRSPISERVLVGVTTTSLEPPSLASFNAPPPGNSESLATALYKTDNASSSVGMPAVLCANMDGYGDIRTAVIVSGGRNPGLVRTETVEANQPIPGTSIRCT